MYSVSNYGDMLADDVRMDAYAEALRRSVSADTVVLDIGTGTGTFALLACKFGARRVYAIEVSDTIQVARELAKANGFDKRIEFIQGNSTAVDLPERADIIVSDLRGALPLYESHIPIIIDARQRFLVPGGRMIPQSDRLWVALVDAPDIYRRYDHPWLDDKYNFDFSAARNYQVNKTCRARAMPEQLLVSPARWAEIDFTTVEHPDFRTDLTWTVNRSGTAHGLHAWFDTTLLDAIGFSNAPGQPKAIYAQTFFPLLHPVEVDEGDQVSVEFLANLINGNYIWTWRTRVLDRFNPGKTKADYKQSDFFSNPVSLDHWHKRAPGYTPVLGPEGLLQKFVLSLMDGTLTLEEISRRISQRFPDLYPTWQDALPVIGEYSREFSR